VGSGDQYRPVVEQYLKDITGNPNLVANENGWPFQQGSARYLVQVLDQEPPLVRVISAVLMGVAKTPQLLDQLNLLNSQITCARVVWAADEVMLSAELLAETLTAKELAVICSGIGQVADLLDDQLKTAFGGRRITD
jgi:hypothetical protein